MKFFFPGWKLSWPAWVPDWLRLFPWVSFCSILVGIAGFIANIILRAKAVGHPVAEWPYPLEPQMLVSGISMISVASLTFGFKIGGIIGFWVRARRGMSLSKVHYVRESTTSMAEAMKAVKRGKALWVAWMSIIFCVVACGNAWFWSHSMYQGDVTIRNNGTLDVHITPDIMSFHIYILSFHVYILSFHVYIIGELKYFSQLTSYRASWPWVRKEANIFCSEYYPLPSQSRFSYEFFPNLFFLPLEPRPFHVVQHDVRLEILTKMVRDLYNTKFGTIHRQRHWRFSDDVIDTGSSYRSHIAAGYAIKPEIQKQGVLPCRMSFLSPMTDIIETYQNLALRISVLAAVDAGITQPVKCCSEKAQRYASAISIVILTHWGFWELPRVFTMSPIELFNAVAHHPHSPQNLLVVLAKAKDDASAWKLKKEGRDEKWGFEVQMEEHELEEQL
ncbi:uncharacterized protein B0T23DRAFT_444467 [Neurospora hispaniola]|uniref:Uncharacterized protein n=1 Tax=Neurospora hispaniola TaxID=588809 RepID=A0AAJ0MQY8_9PEZI|nr:hypothetical protein B0T23DRAFT_444467 [Neurospora hispaniola]